MVASTASAWPASSTQGLDTAYLCVPMGDCEPCPAEHLAYPYCRPYNNRQSVSCTHTETHTKVQGWSACGKFVHDEVRAYTKFVFLNVLLVVLALGLYIWRQKHQTRKYQGMLYQRVHGTGASGSRRHTRSA